MNQFLHLAIGLILTFSIQTLQSQSHAFEHIQIGSKWTYETAEYLIPLVRYDAMTFVVTDTSTLHGKPVFMVENSLNNHKEYIWLDDLRMYFWDEGIQDFQLNYVFDTIASYESTWKGQCHAEEGTATITVDSLSSLIFAHDSILVQHISIADNGTLEQDMLREIYSGIGQNTGGLKLQLGVGFCDFYLSVTQLRCFESNLGSYNFVGFPCDSSWVDLNLASNELKEYDVVVYPNPGFNNLNFDIKGVDPLLISVDLIDATGTLRFSRQDVSHSVLIPTLPSGLYYYRIYNRDRVLGVGSWAKQ